MNKPWRISERVPRSSSRGSVSRTLIMACAALICSTSLSGCYSGWNRQKQDGAADRDTAPTPNASKPFGFLLLEVIRPAVEPGRNDCGNGDSPTLVEFRQHEWVEREAALIKALSPLAEHFVKNDIEIAGSDCQTMQAIESRAGTVSEMGSPLVPQESDPFGRPLIHLKVILWAGAAPSLNASNLPRTFAVPWADWNLLADEGFNGLQTYHQFVLADQDGGIFNNWHDSLNSAQRLDGTSIQNITPTDQATADRRATIAADTTALVQWLQANAIGSSVPPGTPNTIPDGTFQPGTFPGHHSGSGHRPKLNPQGHSPANLPGSFQP